MSVELLTPRRTRVRKQDVYMVGCLANFRNELLNLADLGTVRWNRDGLGTGSLVGKCIEGFAGFSAGGGFAGGYIDFRASGLEEARRVG